MIEAALDPILEGMLGRVVAAIPSHFGFHPFLVHVLRIGIAPASLSQSIAGCAMADTHHDPVKPGSETGAS